MFKTILSSLIVVLQEVTATTNNVVSARAKVIILAVTSVAQAIISFI